MDGRYGAAAMTLAVSVLEQALALAVTPTAAPKPVYVASTARRITRRGILWLGREMRALRHFQEEGIPFRFNTVLSKPALGQLVDIGRLAVRTGAEVFNFLGFNLFNDQTTGKRSVTNVPRYTEIREPLAAAL